MVGSDANDYQGKGVPRETFSIFDIKTELEFDEYDRITFLSVQDLLAYYEKVTGKSGRHLNAYQLTLFYMVRNTYYRYMFDEVPLLKFGE